MLLLKQSMHVKLTDAPNSNVDQTCRIALNLAFYDFNAFFSRLLKKNMAKA